MVRLRLSHNKLSSLPPSFGNLNYLSDLRLDNNFLHPESFPHSFSAMEVQYLDLANNLCRVLPQQLAHLKYITTLDLRCVYETFSSTRSILSYSRFTLCCLDATTGRKFFVDRSSC
jgi:Leucine-rich repeat (LRR) protein